MELKVKSALNKPLAQQQAAWLKKCSPENFHQNKLDRKGEEEFDSIQNDNISTINRNNDVSLAIRFYQLLTQHNNQNLKLQAQGENITHKSCDNNKILEDSSSVAAGFDISLIKGKNETTNDEVGINTIRFTHVNNKPIAAARYQQIQLLSLTLIVLFIISNQNALPCIGSGDTESIDNHGITGYNYFKRFPFLNSMRLFQTEPSELVPPTQPPGGSFSSDQLSSPEGPQQPLQSNSWTSMLTNPFNNNNGPREDLDLHIKKILIPRVSGTPGNVQVRNYIVSTLKNLDYHVELDEFTDPTPVGNVKFANIIASSNPNACRQLVIACHHDSKMMDGFLGAIDSAVPCAMMLKMAETFKYSYRPSNSNNDNADADNLAKEKDSLGLQFVFFDGEEAYVQWGPRDSLYGSRHLASKWEKQAAPSYCGLKNELARIEMMMVLDLIGASDTSFINYNMRLKNQYGLLQKYEKQHLTSLGLTSSQARRESTFKSRYIPLDFVEDDHVPFHKRGVPVLSLLAHPFPKVWHTIDDNYSAIDFPRTLRILHTLEQFVANYTKETS